MKILLLLIVLYKGEVKYLVDVQPSMAACQGELADALAEIALLKEVRVIRAECFAEGVRI